MRIEQSWDGFKWAIREEFRHDIMVLTKREYSILKLLTALSSKDKTFTEIGVHVGYYAIRMAKLYKLVNAIEPDPNSIEALKRNITLNGIANIKIFEVACGDHEGEGELTLREGSSTLLPVEQSFPAKIKVKVKPLDAIIDHTDVMKIDVEGFEENVIKGGLKLIERCRPTIIIEHHDLGGYYQIEGAFQRIGKMLNNYDRFNLDGVRWCWVPHEKLKQLNPEALKLLIVYQWFNKIVDNIANHRPWYYGLPSTWWYGMGILDFIEVLPEYALKEPEWLSQAQQ